MREARWGGLDVRVTGGTDRNGGGHGIVVVLMHGFGVPGNDLVLLPRHIDAPAGTRFVFPAAPIELGGAYGEGRAWWPIDMDALNEMVARGQTRELSSSVPPGMAEANAHVEAMLDALEKDLGPSKLVLGGFSQGSMLACDVALRSTRTLDALVVLSGTALAASEWDPRMEARRGLPVLMTHGDADPLLSMAQAELLRDKFVRAGLAVRWLPFHGGHGVPPEALTAMGTLLHDVGR